MSFSKVLFFLKKKFFFKNSAPVLVAGLGRCGTTLMINSLYKTLGNPIEFVLNSGTNDFKNGTIYKTHDFPNIVNYPKNLKVIFMFGDIRNTVLSASTKINDWGTLHFHHLHAEGFKFNDQLFHHDDLNLEKMFDAWYQPQKFEFLSLRYENLYDERTRKSLNKFLGFELKLLPFEKRNSNFETHPEIHKIEKNYKNLIFKIDQAQDCKIWKSINRS